MNRPDIPISRTGILSLIYRLRSPLYRNSIFLIFNSIFTAGIGFFFWMVVARLYRPADVGSLPMPYTKVKNGSKAVVPPGAAAPHTVEEVAR